MNMGKESLFSETKQNYGPDYQNHFLEQYKLYLSSVEKISDRRQNANSHFITINTALISILGLSFKLTLFENTQWVRALIAFVGIVICVIFWYLLRAYRQLNTGKFVVIHKIERRLPLSLYRYEWEVLGQGKNTRKYYPFSHIELLIPWVFGIVYVLLIIVFLNS